MSPIDIFTEAIYWINFNVYLAHPAMVVYEKFSQKFLYKTRLKIVLIDSHYKTLYEPVKMSAVTVGCSWDTIFYLQYSITFQARVAFTLMERIAPRDMEPCEMMVSASSSLIPSTCNFAWNPFSSIEIILQILKDLWLRTCNPLYTYLCIIPRGDRNNNNDVFNVVVYYCCCGYVSLVYFTLTFLPD